ncbi:hypothetical protein OC842_004328 [Tilletia horrida]|uniref:Altered inheritance of mitochondria protein 5, mitochondrial n=1 Tax=Tilletia horrida TaxID=155126 RepID=A0AAN6JJF4_9BASI|nr:hypothetical protein OC842_004328 [Tilletia horrida]
MAALLAPVAGAIVGTSLLYGLHAVQTARTDAVLAELGSSRAHIDASRDALEASRKQTRREEEEEQSRRAPTRFRSATKPSVTDELRDRWNAHLFEAIDVVSRIQWDIAASKAIQRVRDVLPSSSSEAAESAQEAVDKAKAKAKTGLSLR